MSIRIVRRGNTGQSNDHNLLINRGERDQHPIESITGLKTALNAKYEKPASGIPRKDLGFAAVSSDELEGVRNELISDMDLVSQSQTVVENKISALEQLVSILDDEGNNSEQPNAVDIIQINGFYETTATPGQTVFDLSFDYIPGSNVLEVYVDGVLSGKSKYVESSDTSVTFLNAMYGGEVVTFKAEVLSKLTSPIHETMIYDGNSLVTLSHKYNVGDNSLSVFYNGLRLDEGFGYREVSPNQIEIIDQSIVAGGRLTMRRETHMAGKAVFTPLDSSYMTWSERKTPEADKRTVLFTKSFLLGGNMIQVFIDGILMDPGATGDYVEVTNNSIKFNYDLDLTDEVKTVCNAGLMMWKEKFVSMAGAKRFVLSNPYNPGIDELEVYENGILLQTGEDYVETNRTTVTLNAEPEHGSVIIIFRRR